VACLGNSDPGDVKVYCPLGNGTFDDDEIIQRDRRIQLDDDEIAYLVQDGIDYGLDARAVLDRLLNAGDGVQPPQPAGLPAR
jgi:hypothetical protein